MPTDEQYREMAVKVYGEMGEVDICQNTAITRGIKGAWVTVEVWVSDDEFDNENGQFGVGA